MKKTVVFGMSIVVCGLCLSVIQPQITHAVESNSGSLPTTQNSIGFEETIKITNIELVDGNMEISMNQAPPQGCVYLVVDDDNAPVDDGTDSSKLTIPLDKFNENTKYSIKVIGIGTNYNIKIENEEFYYFIKEASKIYSVNPINSESTKIEGISKPGQKVVVTMNSAIDPWATTKHIGEAIVDNNGNFQVNLPTPISRDRMITLTTTNAFNTAVKEVVTQPIDDLENFVVDGNFHNGLGDWFINENDTSFNQKDGYGNFIRTPENPTGYIGFHTDITPSSNTWVTYSMKVRVNSFKNGTTSGKIDLGQALGNGLVTDFYESFKFSSNDVGTWKEIQTTIPIWVGKPSIAGLGTSDISDMDIKDVSITY